MFGIWNHLSGAISVRIKRWILNLKNLPDISFITNNVGVGGHCSIQRLSEIGVNAILDSRDEENDDPEQLSKYSMDYFRVKIKDKKTPTISEGVDASNWIKEKLNEEKKVFVHCNLGRGRGPLIVCLYLIYEGKGVRETIEIIKKHRKYTHFNQNQLKFIEQFYRFVN